MTERNAYLELVATERFTAAATLAHRADTLRVLQSVGRDTVADHDAVKDAAARWTLMGGGVGGQRAALTAAHRMRRRGGRP